MRTPFKVAAWAAVFLTCAGAGAFIAAHTNPFPPGVDRPSDGTIVSSTPSVTPGPKEQRWTGVIRTLAKHEFYVGGACVSRWRTVVRFRVDPDGTVTGVAVGHVIGTARCDFPQAQVQSRSIRSVVGGRYSRVGVISLVFKHPVPDPTGSTDLGGYLVFLHLPRINCQTTDGRSADETFDRSQGDGDRGTYRFIGAAHLRCLSGCAPPPGV